jgi:hypothetical protein
VAGTNPSSQVTNQINLFPTENKAYSPLKILQIKTKWPISNQEPKGITNGKQTNSKDRLPLGPESSKNIAVEEV